RLLVAEGHDPIKGEVFYRPLGGTIEFGEYSHDTVVRELREEIGAEVVDLEYLATIENVFTYHGQVGHEIVLIHTGRLADPALYGRPALDGLEDTGDTFRAVWKPLTSFSDKTPLYPTGLLE